MTRVPLTESRHERDLRLHNQPALLSPGECFLRENRPVRERPVFSAERPERFAEPPRVLCDEFDRLGLIHASLADTRLVTTQTLLSIVVHNDLPSSHEALSTLDAIGDVRSREDDSYVERARALLDDT